MKKEKKRKSVYASMGVDAQKKQVKEIFGKIVDNDFPGAFCNILRDKKNPGMVKTKHADGSGSKSVQRYLHYLETGDASILRGDPYDAISMNTGDIAACGFLSIDNPYELTDHLAINSGNVEKYLLISEIAKGIREVLELYKNYGFDIEFTGGETADLPDQTNSYTMDFDVRSKTSEKMAIFGNIQEGDKIFGFSSGGRAVWEKEENSGIMSNGLTMGRKVLMHKKYSKVYPFLCSPDKPYQGKYFVNSYPDELQGMSVSGALLSPTRQWAILIKEIILGLQKKNALHLLHGISMNTGGGVTKITNLGKGIMYNKCSMPATLPIFKLIQKESGESWENMYESFNMGIGLDVVGSKEENILECVLQDVSAKTKVPVYETGNCSKIGTNSNELKVSTPYGSWNA